MTRSSRDLHAGVVGTAAVGTVACDLRGLMAACSRKRRCRTADNAVATGAGRRHTAVRLRRVAK